MKRPSRRIAVELVHEVLEQRRPLSDVLPSKLAGVGPADRATAQRLALLSLRSLGRADRVLGRLLRKPPSPMIRQLLRVATSELLGAGSAAHGVVSEAVDTAKTLPGGARSGGLVNAVLRRVAEEGQPIWESAGPTKLPKWLRGRLISTYGSDRVAAMETAHEFGAPVDLTTKSEGRLEGAEILPTGSHRWRGAGAVSDLPQWKVGDIWVQDAGAALAAKWLDAQPSETVIDLCAAPGGKTLQLAAAGAAVTSVDLSDLRMQRVEENLARTGLKARTVIADATNWKPEKPPSAILLDAPCSATGTIRRHPDLPYVKDGKGLRELYALQAALLDNAVSMLDRGGRLVFSTCSLLPEEGEAQVRAALQRHENLELLPTPDWAENDWRVPEGLRLTPDMWRDKGGIDGFFLAGFRKGKT